MDSQKTSILIVGASGRLGSLVTKHALRQSNLLVNILVRDANQVKDLAKEVQQAGGRVIEADLSKPETIKDSTKGIHTIISCIKVEGEGDAQAQKNLLDDATKNGVKRFFPSQYGISYENVSRDNLVVDLKLKTIEAVANTNIKPVVVYCGIVTEYFFMISKQGVYYFGDADQKIDFTSYDDLAQFIIAIAVDPEKSGTFNFVGEELSINDIMKIYNEVRGTDIKAVRAGSIEDLNKKAEKEKNEGQHLKAAYSILSSLVFGGRGKTNKNDNKEFPQVQPTSLEVFLKQNPNIGFA